MSRLKRILKNSALVLLGIVLVPAASVIVHDRLSTRHRSVHPAALIGHLVHHAGYVGQCLHVNIGVRLERGQIITEPLLGLMTEACQQHFLAIDQARVPESVAPRARML